MKVLDLVELVEDRVAVGAAGRVLRLRVSGLRFADSRFEGI